MGIFKRSKKGIKICRIWKMGDLVSAFADGRIVKYKIGKWSKRPEECGPLAVFNNIKSAENFMIDWSSSIFNESRKYFRCKYKESKEHMLYRIYYNGDICKKTILPTGTRFADKVKLLKRVN